MPEWELILLIIIVILGLVSFISLIMKLVGASLRIIISFVVGVASIIMISVVLITIVDLCIDEHLWKDIFHWIREIN